MKRKEFDSKKDFLNSRKPQFLSIFYQGQELIRNNSIKKVLEFGGGNNSLKALITNYNKTHLGVDFDDVHFNPDIVSTILDFQTDETFDVVCAFQVLEHNPKETIKKNIKKMASLSNKYVFISVPYSGRWLSINFNFNFMPTKFGRWNKTLLFTWPRILKKVRPLEKYKKRKDKYNPHWWEVGDKELSKKKFNEIINSTGLKISKSFHNEFFPYHIFYLLEKR